MTKKKQPARKSKRRRKVEEIDELWEQSSEITSEGEALDAFPGLVLGEQKDTYPEDTGDVPSTSSVLQTPDVLETGEVSNTEDVLDTGDVPDTEEVSNTGDVPGTEVVSHTEDVSKTPDVPETEEVPKTSGVGDTTDVPQPSGVPRKYTRRTPKLSDYQWSLSIYRRCIPDPRARVKRIMLHGLQGFIEEGKRWTTRRMFSTEVFDEIADLLRGNWKIFRDIPYYRKVWKSLQKEGYLKVLDMRLDGPMKGRGFIFHVRFPFWADLERDVRKASTRRLLLDHLICTEYLRDGDLSVVTYWEEVKKELNRRKVDLTGMII